MLSASKVPPFTIENDTDGGEDLRMKYRYLDIRRNPVRENLLAAPPHQSGGASLS
ncbi:MAG: hypothetical protein U5L96_00695 [Owenweeksia sp.]|nr:hypothetical protein [Owenweeksia sp.]